MKRPKAILHSATAVLGLGVVLGLLSACGDDGAGSSSANATGDGQFSGNNSVDIGGANLVVADSSCTALKKAYDDCSN